jgi:phosphohistidine phosphatase
MIIYVLRHGIAEDAARGQSDAQRALTSEGQSKLERTLKRAALAGVRPATILTSPYLRAMQTAQIAADVLDVSTPPIRIAELTPDGSPQGVWEQLRQHAHAKELLIAGHEPLLSQLVAYLLDAPALQVEMKKGALVAIECAQLRGQPRGVLLWMLTARLAAE